MEKPLGLLALPSEILQKIFVQVPTELKRTCRTFVVMYNDLYRNLFVDRFGPHILRTIADYDYKYLVDYIRSFDYWRKDIRNIISEHYDLRLPYTDEDELEGEKVDPANKLNCQYIRDSWKLVYGIYVNRRIFVDYDDYTVNSYVNAPMSSVKIDKTLKLTPGLYNLSCALIIKTFAGMSSSVFKVLDGKTGDKLLEYQPASHFSELVPHNKFVLLDIGSFEVKKPKIVEQEMDESSSEESNGEEVVATMEEAVQSKLVDIRVVVEEAGVMVKSGYILCYIDVNAYQLKDCMIDSAGDLYCVNEKYWLAWWIENQPPLPENVVNVLLKKLYKSMEKSMKLIKPTTPHRRMGSFAESNLDARIKRADMSPVVVENEDETDGTDGTDGEVNLETYNREFYSKLNREGELIVREFKFRTMKDRRRYEEWIGQTGEENYSVKSGTVYTMEPLKWKLTTIMEI
ncbi:hypothetical protein PICMEDRAFT_15166 [Pichia membranifaciens NRRL Y-2026]|uniref:Uncharacterized protein n=1 Tax=Pichia membranifaciens NRRL Y-2026 TaxID=763406 RepID=A0A1E3NNF4_9ASCO|nr:hypothetical protein PICMEDRAFT_15166 [Pichia membranifaciens NRRL Y-2026]ODQ47178.1 hypothetical protein PICMEDRAFT_15166 [Pichia membranifaciens NRRL Y-2026]